MFERCRVDEAEAERRLAGRPLARLVAVPRVPTRAESAPRMPRKLKKA
jgi:hypothetical protein